ncbi:prepilin peptidase [Flavobacterium yafengii]|uniref:prepilin peptidase n=1 Tax=Flavobacterium yafengii TaxID=3041253 RepID=UPI0032BFE5B1
MRVAYIGLLFCLLIVFLQDWKYRRIHVGLPLAIFFFSFYLIQHENKILVKIIVYNLFFFLLTLSILIIYMSLKTRKFLNPFQNYFGLGDLLFYVAIAPLFLLQNYILFFIFSMIFAIGLQLGLKKIIQENTVPLAGFSALLLFILIIKDMILDFQKITLL